MKLTTPVEFPESTVKISSGDRIMSLGSCFADNIGKRLKDRGFDICLNPFGTLYNPASIADSIARLDSGEHFTEKDCVQMGSGSTKWCSFHHHTLAARDTSEEFLASANDSLDRASAFWKSCSKVMVTLGTSWCYRHIGGSAKNCDSADVIGCAEENGGSVDIIGNGGEETIEGGIVVANCLKRDAKEFRREFLEASETGRIVRDIILEHPDKQFIFTVSPIRHFKDGAHGNQLSKANLLIGLESGLKAVSGQPEPPAPTPKRIVAGATDSSNGMGVRCDYFPAYEIMLDELRGYRFYAEDMIHPSEQAADYIFERFIDWVLPKSETEEFKRREKVFRQSQHINLSSRMK